MGLCVHTLTWESSAQAWGSVGEVVGGRWVSMDLEMYIDRMLCACGGVSEVRECRCICLHSAGGWSSMGNHHQQQSLEHQVCKNPARLAARVHT
jgi:hypothetical protein